MKFKLFLFLLIVSGTLSARSVDINEVARVKLETLPSGVKVTSSSVEAVDYFLYASDKIILKDFNGRIYSVENKKTVEGRQLTRARDFYPDSEGKAADHNSLGVAIPDYNDRKYYFKNAYTQSIFERHKTLITVSDNTIIINGRNGETVTSFINCDYADLIGIDSRGFSYVLTERFLSHLPVKVERKIYSISPDGSVTGNIRIPLKKYITVKREFFLDPDGSVYQFLSDRESLWIMEIRGLDGAGDVGDKYYLSQGEELHYNYFLSEEEYTPQYSRDPALSLNFSGRTEALLTGESYVTHKYYCASDNIAYTDIEAPDGDIVRTPAWLVTGWNSGVPYKWGGFSTLSHFDAGLAVGRYAGDIHTQGVCAYAVGVDCSGYVSRCWNLAYHYSTSMMPAITETYGSWYDLKPGDGVHKVGHVRLFVNFGSDGSIRCVESTSTHWDVSYYLYAPSDLGNYSPVYYVDMEDNYFNRLTKITSVVREGNDVTVSWDCDTNNVAGYRLYRSDGESSWEMIMDESLLKDKEVTFTAENNVEFYRVSAIKNDSEASEGLLSNAAGSGFFGSDNKYCVVDGFTRNLGNGSWKGAVHNFSMWYGNSLGKTNTDFDFMASDEINSAAGVSDYNALFWIMGDESSGDETFNDAEQQILKDYLMEGGALFVSGSEIGWDLSHLGSATDKDFYINYLKALFEGDDANDYVVEGNDVLFPSSLKFNFGQTYIENYPDYIAASDGAALTMKYENGRGAGVVFNGTFGNSSVPGKLIYLAFPLETAANESSFDETLEYAHSFFSGALTNVNSDNLKADNFILYNNFPNPFNPSTTLSFFLSVDSDVKINLYDISGSRVAEIYNGKLEEGNHKFEFKDQKISSGIYFANYLINDKLYSQKIMLIK